MKKKIIIIAVITVLVFGILAAIRLQKWYNDIGVSGGIDAIHEPVWVATTEDKGTEISCITSPGTGRIKVQWNSRKNEVAGYLLEYSIDSGFSFTKSTEIEIADSKVTKKTIRKLESGTTYYVRIRSYMLADEIKRYTNWSEIKSVTVK